LSLQKRNRGFRYYATRIELILQAACPTPKWFFFGRIQIDGVLEMQKWVDNLRSVEDERITLATITANNHYTGFGPGTVNIFGNMLWLPEAKWEDRRKEQEQKYGKEKYRDMLLEAVETVLGYFGFNRSARRKAKVVRPK
jgi:hypothetical protein